MKVHEPTVHDLGPAATHDQACAVCWKNPAVLDLTHGVFEPCWDCQSNGYRLTHMPSLRRWWKRR